MVRKLFLPGAGASVLFWRGVVDHLPPEWDFRCLAWPGLGAEPHNLRFQGIDDLVGLVIDNIGEQADLIAQSMGGLVALKVAMRAPSRLRRLVLTGTSGGLPMPSPASEWRDTYRAEYPNALPWITEVREDLSVSLPTMEVPTLLLWGNRDTVSPVSAGERLLRLLPNAVLHVIDGGGHDFPETHSPQTAEKIRDYLS